MNWVEAETARSGASLPRRLVNLQLLSWLSCVQAWNSHELSTELSIFGSRSFQIPSEEPENIEMLPDSLCLIIFWMNVATFKVDISWILFDSFGIGVGLL